MKTKLALILAALTCLLTLNSQLSTLLAQGTAFTYQGRLTAGGNLANGLYDLTFRLFDAQSGGTQVGPALTNAPVGVSNGLFTATLDFGVGIFAGDSRWLAVGVRTNGGGPFSTLPGRQPLTPSPYAIHAADAVTATSAGTAMTADSVALGGVNTAALADNAITSAKIADGTIASADLSPSVLSSTFWRLDGNAGTTAGTHFLGTTDNQALELKVNDLRALRLEPNASGAPNVLAGAPVNEVAPGILAATIGGGGAADYHGYLIINRIEADFATVSGGGYNIVQAGATNGTIGGGWVNTIETNARGATIGGGIANRNGSWGAMVGGGNENEIAAASDLAVIPGGSQNQIGLGSFYSIIGGGIQNRIEAGGRASTIGGGDQNVMLSGAEWATISGGMRNTNTADYAFIGGGSYNAIQTEAGYSTVGGGNQNRIRRDAHSSTIAGGYENEIGTNAYMSTVGGGDNNVVQSDANHASIGGGGYNSTAGAYATVPGGRQNVATNYAFAAGRRAKALHAGSLVWADSTDADFASTANNQFLIRASGGVGIGTASPQQPLHVAGDTMVQGTNFTALGHTARLILGDENHIIRSIYGAGLRLGVWPDPYALSIQDVTANVGIGTTNPATRLQVVGTVSATGFSGNGSGLTQLDGTALKPGSVEEFALAGDSVTSSRIVDGTIIADDVSPNTFWKANGNSGIGAGNFLGTTDSQPLEFRVGGQRAFRFDRSASDGSVIVIGGGAGNSISPILLDGATIAGGYSNTIGSGANSATIGGGQYNTIGTLNAWSTTIGGGSGNRVEGRLGVIAGGLLNSIRQDGGFIGGGSGNAIVGLGGDDSVIAGGQANTNRESYQATIGGGRQNAIWDDAQYATIAGGGWNTIQTNATYGTIGGGAYNTLWQDATNAVITGGLGNAIARWSESSALGGGKSNRIEAAISTISGGSGNLIEEWYAEGSTISGGTDNHIEGSPDSTIGGGINNAITVTSGWSTIGGGEANKVIGNAHYCTIAGGATNCIETPAEFAALAGGSLNTVRGSFSAIGGGHANVIDQSATGSTIAGGESNVVAASSSYAFAAGRRAKANHTGVFVWADSQDADFASTRNDEFNIRAAGGVRIDSNRGIALNEANAPLITRSYDPFTSGTYTGLGRWGLFMEYLRLAIGIADLPGRYFEVAKYATDGTSVPLLTLDQAGNLNIRGGYGYISDRNAKENFKAVDSWEVLEKVAALPISRWNFKQDAAAQHLGPVAQDFHAAFGLGADDKHITSVDADGVALAAIQGLNEKVVSGKHEVESRMQRLEAENAELKKRLERLERLLAAKDAGTQ